MSYQAVLFDLDGTLLNTLQDLAEAVNAGLGRLGLPVRRLEEFKYLVGQGREEMARLALPENRRDPETVDRLASYFTGYYADHWADHTRPYPGIPELLDALAGKGIRMAVLSNKPQDFTVTMVSGLLGRWHFERVAGAGPGRPLKPDPAAAWSIAEQMQLRPEQFIYAGDSGIDMQTAVRAGMFPVGVLWGFRTAEELKAAGAKVLLKEPGELMKMLDSIHDSV